MLAYLPLIIPLLIIAIVVAILATFFISRHQRDMGGSGQEKSIAIRDANKRLSNNPKDTQALTTLAEIHYDDENYKQAFKTYSILQELTATNPKLNEQEIVKRYGLSAFYSQLWNEAYKFIAIARSKEPDDYELNHALGILEYKKGSYEKAINLLLTSLKLRPGQRDATRHLGLSLYRIKRYKEAVSYLRNAASGHPDDKEVLYSLAKSLYELSQLEQALKLFTHLRPDPKWGPQAALFSGTINKTRSDFEHAILDFEIGLKHKDIHPDVRIELKYRLSEVYNKTSQLDKSLMELDDIYEMNPKYKDVGLQREKIKELSGNQNLKTYLLSPVAEFQSLCRRMVLVIFPKTRVKVVDVSTYQNEYLDILAEIKAQKWEDVVLFRFYRGEGQIGELMVRELYVHIKEVHAGRGFCLSAGNFTPEAESFVEARLIDLINKDRLKKILNKIKNSL